MIRENMHVVKAMLQRPGFYRLSLRCGGLAGWSERLVRTLTRGRIGVLDLAGLPSLQLTVSGRRSGIRRTTSLQYIPDGDDLLLVASNWGGPRHPAWSANLMAATQVTVQRRDDRFTASVRLLEGADRARAWDTALRFWPNYRIAQEMAAPRQFRIFALTPSDRPSEC